MRLKDLLEFNKITIQCHDNPDADAIASGYALYRFFKANKKNVSLIYSGINRVQKSNLILMIGRLGIPLEYVSPEKEIEKIDGLLITVDCQYGAGNVTKFHADEIAIIDHHQVENADVELSVINAALSSCSTLVWQLLKTENYIIDDSDYVGTALYYGLYTDTNQFSELFNPYDLDAADSLVHDKSLITLFKNANISLRELEIASIAMLRYAYNEDYAFAVVKSQECDPNVLGLISDFLLQVDKIETCVVYNDQPGGFKISVRSCVKEVNASELACFLTEGVGQGGGHYDKAGGFISRNKFAMKYPNLHSEGYFHSRMKEYFDSFELIYARDYEADIDSMELYQKKNIPVGFVKMTDMLPEGTPITVRTLEGDMDIRIEDDLIVMIGIKGEVYPNKLDKFNASNQVLDKKYVYEECVIDNDYTPTVKNRITGENLLLEDYAKVCVPTGAVKIYAKELDRDVKVFTAWDKEKYMLGRRGDYIAVRADDLHDVYVVEKKIFAKTYSKV